MDRLGGLHPSRLNLPENIPPNMPLDGAMIDIGTLCLTALDQSNKV